MFLFAWFFFLFNVQSNCGRFTSKNETPPGFAVGMLRSPKTEFQGKPYGLHSLLSRSDKACFFFLFPSKVILIIHAFKWLHAKLCQHSKFFAMPIANRNTEVSLVVSGDCQQKHILRVIVALTRPCENNLPTGNLDWTFFFLTQKQLELAAVELVNGCWPCARRFNHDPLSVSVSFFNHS